MDTQIAEKHIHNLKFNQKNAPIYNISAREEWTKNSLLLN